MEATHQEATTETSARPTSGVPLSAELARRVADIAADKKASDIVILDIRPVSYLADYFVILSGESERQIKAITDALTETLRKEGLRPIHAEGTSSSGWILLDYGDVVVHIFSPATRNYYHLEKVWGDAGLVLRMQ